MKQQISRNLGLITLGVSLVGRYPVIVLRGAVAISILGALYLLWSGEETPNSPNSAMAEDENIEIFVVDYGRAQPDFEPSDGSECTWRPIRFSSGQDTWVDIRFEKTTFIFFDRYDLSRPEAKRLVSFIESALVPHQVDDPVDFSEVSFTTESGYSVTVSFPDGTWVNTLPDWPDTNTTQAIGDISAYLASLKAAIAEAEVLEEADKTVKL